MGGLWQRYDYSLVSPFDPAGAFLKGTALGQRQQEINLRKQQMRRSNETEQRKIADERHRAQGYQMATAENDFFQSLQRAKKVGVSGSKYNDFAAGAYQNFNRKTGQFLDVDLSDEQQVGEAARASRLRMTALSDPEKFHQYEQQVADKVVIAEGDASFADPRVARTSEFYKPSWDEVMALDARTARAGASRTTVNVNGDEHDPLTTGARTAAQKKIQKDQSKLIKLNEIGALIDSDMFTIGGRIQQGAANMLSHFDPRLPNWLAKDGVKQNIRIDKARTLIEQFFNAYRHDITGAQASVAEIDRLMNAVINNKITWNQFSGRFETAKNEITRNIRLGRRVLKDGISLSREDVAADVKALMVSGDQGNSAEDRELRKGQLKADGVPPEKFIEIMHSEGYWSDEEYREAKRRIKAK